MSRPLIVNMILFVNISNFLKQKFIYVMIFGVPHLDTRVYCFVFIVCKGKMLLSILMISVMCLRFCMQDENILELLCTL